MMAKRRIRIGTSGWHYDHWKGPFYPEDIASADLLQYYAKRFKTVEVNNTFYQLPDKDTLCAWRTTAHPRFVFAVKASRYITHMKKLKDPGKTLPSFLARVDHLGDTLGPILFQLPPRWRRNEERLAQFLDALPEDRACAFEFRDRSWYSPGVYRLLREHGAAFCIYHLAGHQSPVEATAQFVYIRLHGPGAAYEGSYSDEALARWADRMSGWAQEGLDIYCYFDNDQSGYAPRDAFRLQSLLAA